MRQQRNFVEEGIYDALTVGNLADFCVDGKPVFTPVRGKGRQSRVHSYQAKFVGVIVQGTTTSVFTPKFLGEDPQEADLDVVFSAIRLFRQRTVRVAAGEGFAADASDGNLCGIALDLIDDFIRNGLYTTSTRTQVSEGSWAIDWPRTVSQTTPVVVNGTPVYVDVKMQRNQQDGSGFISILHKAILSDIERVLSRSGIATLMGLTFTSPRSKILSALGATDKLVSHINRALTTEFISWKRRVLSLMRDYLLALDSQQRDPLPLWFGTSNFELLWEDACRVALHSQPSTWETVNPHWDYWASHEGQQELIENAQPSAYLLDALVISETGAYIVDAKYYSPLFTPRNVERAPGINDVTKQFAYQSAIEPWLRSADVALIGNVFIVPSRTSKPSVLECRAVVSYPELSLDSKRTHLPISVIEADSFEILHCYLANKQLPPYLLEQCVQDGLGSDN